MQLFDEDLMKILLMKSSSKSHRIKIPGEFAVSTYALYNALMNGQDFFKGDVFYGQGNEKVL